jgi:hypothetical protein
MIRMLYLMFVGLTGWMALPKLADYGGPKNSGRIGLADKLSVDSRTTVEACVMPRWARRSPEPAPVRATRAPASRAAAGPGNGRYLKPSLWTPRLTRTSATLTCS